MKRILFQSHFWLFILTFSLGISSLFAQNNTVFRESYGVKDIHKIDISLRFEDIKIQTINGENVILEIDTNNSNLRPEIKVEDEKLLISQNSWGFTRGDWSLLALYLPVGIQLSSLKINNLYGNIQVQNLKCQDSVEIQSDNGQIEIKQLTSEYLSLNVSDCPPVKLTGLSLNYFDITGTHADFDVNLLHAPLAKSLVRSKMGKINLSLPKSDNFEIQASSTKSYITNQFTNSKTQSKEFKTYIHNQGGPLITLQTFEGDITISQ
ncbi:MAG: DUF4097 domain-containing protein [Treponema sp.]|nr:DUF4097 domain-containing protein [Treponema sp.]